MNFIGAVVVFTTLLTVAWGDETYSSKWDHIDVDEILKSDRLLNNYYKCLMDQGSCTPDGADLKRYLPDALKTDCIKCTEKQKENTEKVIDFLMKNRVDMWKALEAKYDPDGSYFKRKYGKPSGT